MKLILLFLAIFLMSAIRTGDDQENKKFTISELSLEEYQMLADGLKSMPLSGEADTRRDVLFNKIVSQWQKQATDTTKKK